jgi:hypothetical protein
MSSIFRVNELAYTLVSSASLDFLLDRMSEQLEPVNPSLADFVRRSRTTYTLAEDDRYVEELNALPSTPEHSWNFSPGYCDLTELSDTDLQLVYQAMEQVFDQVALLRPSYPIFLAQVCARCKALVRLDSRLPYDNGAGVRIGINGTSKWEGPEWVGDVLVENLTAQATEFMEKQQEPVQVSEEDSQLIQTLLVGRSWHREQWRNPHFALDMSGFSNAWIERLLPKIDEFVRWEALPTNHSLWRLDLTPNQVEEFFGALNRFVDLMYSDERVIAVSVGRHCDY